MATLKLEIVTPEAIAFSEDVEMVTLPAIGGQIGIYPQHVRLITQMVPGELIATRNGNESLIAVGEGLVAVSGDRVEILTDMAIRAEELDAAKVEEARKRAKARREEKIADESVATLNASVVRSLAHLPRSQTPSAVLNASDFAAHAVVRPSRPPRESALRIIAAGASAAPRRSGSGGAGTTRPVNTGRERASCVDSRSALPVPSAPTALIWPVLARRADGIGVALLSPSPGVPEDGAGTRDDSGREVDARVQTIAGCGGVARNGSTRAFSAAG